MPQKWLRLYSWSFSELCCGPVTLVTFQVQKLLNRSKSFTKVIYNKFKLLLWAVWWTGLVCDIILREPSIGCLQGSTKSGLALDTNGFSHWRVSFPILNINLVLIVQIFQCFFLVWCWWSHRCQGAEAFEIQQLGLANGIFMKFLKDRLLEDKKVTVLLDEVAEGELQLTALTVSSVCITENNFASMSFLSWWMCYTT